MLLIIFNGEKKKNTVILRFDFKIFIHIDYLFSISINKMVSYLSLDRVLDFILNSRRNFWNHRLRRIVLLIRKKDNLILVAVVRL